jgi:hypothetical protein
MNVEIGPRNSFLEIHKWNFRCSVSILFSETYLKYEKFVSKATFILCTLKRLKQ